MSKIDVSRYVREMEQVLRSGQDRAEWDKALAILGRWQFDLMLDDDSRARAKILVQEFHSHAAPLPTGVTQAPRRQTPAAR